MKGPVRPQMTHTGSAVRATQGDSVGPCIGRDEHDSGKVGFLGGRGEGLSVTGPQPSPIRPR